MSVIIRLQNLPWSANAHDIREFFTGLSIPEGGVHIVGGELGDSFIAFSSDEDARLAMRKTATALKGIQVSLLLSSRTEMQSVIESARQQALGLQTYVPQASATPPVVQVAVPIQQQVLIPHENRSNERLIGQSNPFSRQSLFVPIINSKVTHNIANQPPLSMNPFPPGILPLTISEQQNHVVYNKAIPNITNVIHPVPISSTKIPISSVTPVKKIDAHSSVVGTISQNFDLQDKNKSPSLNLRDGKDRRDKIRDDRHKRSKSRSRSRDRDRRRRHRSRSRDRNVRRRRSRSRDRSERDRSDRDRIIDRKDRERDNRRPVRDRIERISSDGSLPIGIKVINKSSTLAGIPGLGEIPVNIPKEGLSILNSSSSRLNEGPIVSTGDWNNKETAKEHNEIEEVIMEDVTVIPHQSMTLPTHNTRNNIISPRNNSNNSHFMTDSFKPPSMSVPPPPIYSNDPRKSKNESPQIPEKKDSRLSWGESSQDNLNREGHSGGWGSETWNRSKSENLNRNEYLEKGALDPRNENPPPPFENAIKSFERLGTRLDDRRGLRMEDDRIGSRLEDDRKRLQLEGNNRVPRIENNLRGQRMDVDQDSNKDPRNNKVNENRGGRPDFSQRSSDTRMFDRPPPQEHVQNKVDDHPLNREPFNQGREKFNESKEPMEQGRESFDQGRKSFDQGRKSFDQGRESFGHGRKPFDHGRESFDQGREPFDQGREPFDQGREPFDQGREPFDQGREPFDQGREPFNQGREPFNQERKPFNQEREPFNQEREPFNQEREPFNQGKEPFNQGKEPFSQGREPFSQGREPFNQGKEPFSQGREPFSQGREPFNQGREPFNQGREPFNQGREPFNQGREPFNQGRGAFNRGRGHFNHGRGNFHQKGEQFEQEKEQFTRDRESMHRERGLASREREPINREREPINREREPISREREPINREREPINREREPINREREPVNREREPVNIEREPNNREKEPINREREPINKEREPINREREPINREREPNNRDRTSFNREREPSNRQREPSNRERESFTRDKEPVSRDRDRESFNRDREPFNRESFNRNRGASNRGRESFNKSKEPLNHSKDSFKDADSSKVGRNSSMDGRDSSMDGRNSSKDGRDDLSKNGGRESSKEKREISKERIETSNDGRDVSKEGKESSKQCTDDNYAPYTGGENEFVPVEDQFPPGRNQFPPIRQQFPHGRGDFTHNFHHGREDFRPRGGFFRGDFRGGRFGRGGFRGRGRGGDMGGGRPPRGFQSTSVEILNLGQHIRLNAVGDHIYHEMGITCPKGSIKLLGDPQGVRLIGVALIRFHNPDEAFEVTKLSGSFIHDNEIQVNIIDEIVYDRNHHFNPRSFEELSPNPEFEMKYDEDYVDIPEQVPTQCLRIRGLPIGFTEHDVISLFDIKVEEVILEYEKGSCQPSGTCYVRLSSPSECEQAVNKLKNKDLDGSHIQINLCPAVHLEMAANEKKKLLANKVQDRKTTVVPHKVETRVPEKTKDDTPKSTGSTELLTDCVVIKNASPDVTESSIRDFFSEDGLKPENIYFNRPDSKGKSDVFVVFPEVENSKKAKNKTSQMLGSNKVSISLISKPSVMKAMGLPFNPLELFKKGGGKASTPLNTSNNGSSNLLEVKSSQPPPDFGKPNCVIALGNVSYQADTNDILNFLSDYKLVAENVIRRYDETNRPTADARVALSTPELASDAIRRLNKTQMKGRSVFMSIVT